MEEMLFDVYDGLAKCTGDNNCDGCPYKEVDDMECIDALMLDCMMIFEEMMGMTTEEEEEEEEEKKEDK